MAEQEEPLFLDASMEDLFAEAVASVERHQKHPLDPSDTTDGSDTEVIEFDIDTLDQELAESLGGEPADSEPLSDPFTDELPPEDPPSTEEGAGSLIQIVQGENEALKADLAKTKALLATREQDIAAMVKRFEEAQVLYKIKVTEAKQNRERAKEFQSRNSHLGGEIRKAIDRIKRQKSQIEALRHRFRKEQEELKRYGAEKPFLALLTVVDNLNLALEHAGAEQQTLKEGVQITLSQFRSIIATFGVEPIMSVKGDAFDPSLQEAILRVETNDVPNGAIYEVLQEGYTYHDRLLRPTRVSVGRSMPQAALPDSPDSLDDAIAETQDSAPIGPPEDASIAAQNPPQEASSDESI